MLRIGINYLFLRIRIDLLNLIAQLIENNGLQKADYLTFVPQYLELHCKPITLAKFKELSRTCAIISHSDIFTYYLGAISAALKKKVVVNL